MKRLIISVLISLSLIISASSLFSQEVRCKINTDYRCDSCDIPLTSANYLRTEGVYYVFECPGCGTEHHMIVPEANNDDEGK